MSSRPRSRLPTVNKPATTRDKLRESLLSWYDTHGRDLPWRTRNGLGDPYRVWLSEVMLQQTTVAAVTPYYQRFVGRWSDVAALAGAARGDVLEAWAGLGYYARARNLHAAAAILAARGFPDTQAGWRMLPGVGSYTAAAIAAFAFGEATNVVDGNVDRVMARLFGVATALPKAKRELAALASGFVSPRRPGDWAQALMDLGATVCTPRAPRCGVCPWASQCMAHAEGAPQSYPRRAAKAARPLRYGAVFRVERDGKIWLVRRPDKGLLGGMAGLPTTPWRETLWLREEAVELAPLRGAWKRAGEVTHVFTHFALALEVYERRSRSAAPTGEGWWGEASALPAVFKKAALLGRRLKPA